MLVSFNLVSDAWVPVVWSDGSRSLVSLRGLFAEPSRVARLDVSDPLMRMAVFRLLLAVVYGAHPGGLSVSEARSLLSAGRDAAVSAYLDRWEGVFGLCGDVPFGQVAGMVPSGDVEPYGLARLHPGLQRPVWQVADPFRPVGPERAVLLLLACQSYGVSGIQTGMLGDPLARAGKRMSQGVAQAGGLSLVVVEGSGLWGSLLSSLAPHDGGDTPVWECGPLGFDGPDPVEPGVAFRCTFPSRRVRLLWDGGGSCSGAWVTYGLRSDWSHPDGEPCAFWASGSGSSSPRPVSLSFGPLADRPLWALWDRAFVGADGARRFPAVLDWAWRLSGSDVVRFRSLSVAYGTQSSSMARVRVDRLALSRRRVEEDAGAVSDVVDAVSRRAWGRMSAGWCPADAWGPWDAGVRAWLAGGAVPDVPPVRKGVA